MDNRAKFLILATGLLGLLVGVVLIAQGGDDEGGGQATAEPTAEKPDVQVPNGPPPDTLQIETLEEGEGEGEGAEAGDTVSVQYVGVLYRNGEEFDSNWGSGQFFDVELGAGAVIPGWDQGLVGIEVGETRRLTIPAALAYGEQGQPPTIPPNSALIFVVEAVRIA